MPCPFCGAAAVTSVTGAWWLLFMRDSLRRVWWLSTGILLLLWLGYFLAFRERLALTILEVLSVALILGFAARFGWLVVRRGMRPPGYTKALALHEMTSPYVNRTTVALKTAGVALLCFQFSADLTISWVVYAGLVLALVGWFLFVWARGRTVTTVNAMKSPFTRLFGGRTVVAVATLVGLVLVLDLQTDQRNYWLFVCSVFFVGWMSTLVLWEYLFRSRVVNWWQRVAVPAETSLTMNGAGCPFGFGRSTT